MIRFTKIEHNVRELLPKLTEYMASRSDIEVVYLFGSFGEERETSLSDVDIAVLLTSEDGEKYFEIRLALMAEAAHMLQTNEVDVVILNTVSLSLRYEVVSSGKILFERDPGRRIDFEVETISRYLDTQPLRRIQREYFLKQIQEGAAFG